MSLLFDLTRLMESGFEAAGIDPAFGAVSVSDRPDLGQFQCNGGLAAARTVGRNPRQIAQQVTDKIESDPRLAEVSIAGPGFINLSITDQALADYLEDAALDTRLGVAPAENPLRVVVDYAGPNVAKAMHVGHLRSTIIGDTLKRLFRLSGHQVLGDAHFGDWGLQMGMLIIATRRRHPDLPHFDQSYSGPYPDSPPISLTDLQEWYPQIAQEVEGDEQVANLARKATTDLQSGRPGYVALWEHFVEVSRHSQQQDFSDLGVEFDLWYGESTVAHLLRPLVDDFLARGVAVRSEGAVLVEVAQPDDKAEIAPLVLETSLGAFLYGTTDVATIQMRVEEMEADLVVYVVDARQSYHFQQVFRAAELGGLVGGTALEHVRFGTMNAADGTPFRTREGGVLRLRDLIEMVTEAAAARLDESDLAADYSPEERAVISRQIGIAALKFGDLINNRASDYLFDLRRFTALEGKTGPYLQMAAVRTGSILERAARKEWGPGPVQAPDHEAERRLMLRILQLPEVIERALELRAPNHLAEFAYAVAGDFSRFYESCHILSEPDPTRRASWLRLVETVRRVLALLLDLLGIEIPARM
ncbi:MAG: arginine--tRNA ligase [bacterium]|nr:arginine--tRNA ligase [bacterium]MCY3651869.1 arginine--tRNA ligase [bacterium]MYD04155.1 arginine--tRNA ligase [Acidimicrobiia bacterium]